MDEHDIGKGDTKTQTGGANITCSFCGRSQREVKKLIAGPNCYICNECIELCNDIIAEEGQTENKGYKSYQLLNHLNHAVAGHETAKKCLAELVTAHHLRFPLSPETGEYGKFALTPRNILIIGPTGVGKSLMAKTIAGALKKIPFVYADASMLFRYRYSRAEYFIDQIYTETAQNTALVEHSIVFLDQLDHLLVDGAGNDGIKEDRQASLLELLSGKKVFVDWRTRPAENYYIDTSGILFIGAGTFDRLQDLIQKRAGEPGRDCLNLITPEDLIEAGYLKSFISRFPIIITLLALRQEDFRKILVEPPFDMLKDYTALLGFQGVKVRFSDQGAAELASLAVAAGRGVFGLKSILDKLYLRLLLDESLKNSDSETTLEPRKLREYLK